MSDRLRKARLLRAAIGRSGPVEPAADDWPTWVTLAIIGRMVPQLYSAVSGAGETLTRQIRESEEMLLEIAATSVRLEHGLLSVATSLEAAGVDFAVLKGVATAHLDHAGPTDRQFGDVDLLVSPRDAATARAALESDDWRQAYPIPPHHERFAHAFTFRGHGIVEIDLHQRIGHRALGLLVPTSELLDVRVPFEIAGRRMWALDAPDRLIHAAIHAVSSRGGYRRLSTAADILVLSEKLAPDAEAVLRRAEQWRIRTLVEASIRNAYGQALLSIPRKWQSAMQRPVDRRDRLVERAYLGPQRRLATEEVAHLRLMRSWRDAVLYVWGYLRMDFGQGLNGLRARLSYLCSRLRQRL